MTDLFDKLTAFKDTKENRTFAKRVFIFLYGSQQGHIITGQQPGRSSFPAGERCSFVAGAGGNGPGKFFFL